MIAAVDREEERRDQWRVESLRLNVIVAAVLAMCAVWVLNELREVSTVIG